MVRTLVFHSNNVGSNPAGPIFMHGYENNFQMYFNTLEKTPQRKIKFDFRYSFMFTSLISPQLTTEFRTRQWKDVYNTYNRSSRISIKKSYLMLTWMYYLTFALKSTNKTNEKTQIIKFGFLPSTRKTYTLTKAPMAHKTFSKEQFAFKFYKFKVSIKAALDPNYQINSLNQSTSALLIAKNSFPVFETNMMFLKFYKIKMLSTAPHFYSYFKFIYNTSVKR